MQCRPGCAACCIAPSISSSIPGLPHGKAAGEACPQLDGQGLCRLFGMAQRPAVCSNYQPDDDCCGQNRREALQRLASLESATRG